MPFITEELWQQVAPLAGKTNDTISTEPYPQADTSLNDNDAVNAVEWVKHSVMGVRKIRAEMNINPGKKLPVIVANATSNDKARIEEHGALVKFLARLDNIELLADGQDAPESASALVESMQLLIPMAGLIDKESELKRLDKEIDRLTGEVTRLTKKLSNEGFTAKAPPEVVALEQQKLDDAKTALEQRNEQRTKIAAL